MLDKTAEFTAHQIRADFVADAYHNVNKSMQKENDLLKTEDSLYQKSVNTSIMAQNVISVKTRAASKSSKTKSKVSVDRRKKSKSPARNKKKVT